MFRYLIDLSYIGTSFRGIQRVVTRKGEEVSTDIHSVQGVLELALKKLRPANEVNITVSSRTDAGVHALSTSVHVDLERPGQDKNPYNPSYISQRLNNTFFKYEIPVRINRVYIIPPGLDFHCRHHAAGRTYLYRFAVVKPEKVLDFNTHEFLTYFIPIEETDRCFFIQPPRFDIEAVKEVLPYFVGLHDFRSFMGSNPTVREKHCMFALRTIDNIQVNRGQSSASVFNRSIANDTYDYYDFTITGKSFIYRQVRRIVSSLIYLGLGRITKKDIYEMITIPSSQSWDSRVQVVPACGLYLCKVFYKQDLFKQIQDYNESFDATTGKKKQIEAN